MPFVQIKRSSSTATPASLNQGELAYSENSDNLFIGNIAGDGVIRIGGKSVIDELAVVVHNTLFNANTIITANVDDTPLALTVAPSTIVGRTSGGNIDALTATEARTILNVEDNADVTDSTNVNTAGAIMHTDVSESDGYVIKASSETYVAIKINRSATSAPVGTDDTSLGYGVGSYWYDVTNDKVWVCIDNTDSSAVWKDITITSDGTVASTGAGYADNEIVAYADGTGESIKTTNILSSDLTLNSDFNANTILTADTDNTPTPLTIPVQTIVGRITAGNIDALTPAEVRTLLNVADGATNYTHPTHAGDDIDYDSTPQSGATVFSDIDINVTTDTDGHVTDANVAIATRELTAGDIGASGTGHDHDGTYEPADATIVKSDEAETITANWTHSGTLSIATPTLDAHAATKGYVDGVAQGLDPKESVRAGSTADVAGTYANTGGTSSRGQFTGMTDTIDGVSLAVNDRVLLKDQTGSGAENGIWEVTTLGSGANGVWERAEDFDEDDEVTSGAFTFVEEGTDNANTGWVLSTADPITIGGGSGTVISFVQFSGAGSYTAHDQGVKLTGTEFTFEIDGTTLSQSASGAKVASGGITNTEVNATAAIAFSKMANLANNFALESNGTGDVSVSAVTSTELGYVSGVTSSIQTQLGNKAESYFDLTDTDDTTYTAKAGQIVVVNSTPDGLVFTDSIDAGTF